MFRYHSSWYILTIDSGSDRKRQLAYRDASRHRLNKGQNWTKLVEKYGSRCGDLALTTTVESSSSALRQPYIDTQPEKCLSVVLFLQ